MDIRDISAKFETNHARAIFVLKHLMELLYRIKTEAIDRNKLNALTDEALEDLIDFASVSDGYKAIVVDILTLHRDELTEIQEKINNVNQSH